MAESNLTLAWVFRGRASKSGIARFRSLTKRLEMAGCRIHPLAAPAKGFSAEWLKENLPAPCAAVLCHDEDWLWVSMLVRGCRQLPVIWVYGRNGVRSLASMAQIGVDDVWPSGLSGQVAFARLQLRLRAQEHLATLAASAQELEVKSAKAETALKQREEFLSVCAHDLRSPLGLIQSSLSMLLAGEAPKPTLAKLQTELITRAKRQAGQALALVHDLLDVMTFEQGFRPRYQLFSLHRFLNEFCADYRFQAEQQGVHLHYENPISEWRVVADADRLRQLLQNLMVNALKFTGRDKNIYLRVSPFQGRRKADPPHPMLLISLTDEGKGIPQKEKERIFDRFSQMRDQSRPEGRGLGLAVAKQISNLHDGNIWVESEEGKGSTFFVLIPHAVGMSKPLKLPNAKRKFLVVEPDVEKREDRFGKLTTSGEVLYAKDAIEAITLYHHHRPDVVLVRAGLGRMSEAELSVTLKSDPAASSTPFVMAVLPQERGLAKLDDVLSDALIELPATSDVLATILSSINTAPEEKAA